MRVLLIALFLFFNFISYSQTKEGVIKNIRQQFQLINADKTLKRVVLENEEFLENVPDGGGELKGFFRHDSLVKIIEWIGLSYGNRIREYYFINGNLFFAFEKFESFVETKNHDLDHSKTKITFEGRYYLNKNKIIDQKITGKRTFDEDSKNIVTKLQDEANNDMKLLKKTTNK
jgi:hypothetical protein